ncbi:hypothetical protein A2272_02575 [Candidatus Peregrinibacteria bacterium RIFOXYA12_FULL_33_12]|nr:MAG: hypothetical protein A2272_02575 [Candidatus Peregrinibacteria bacterium RIFOXYA12_FULL_33_12]OGJ51207.1 MAG: hypothetical protein A2307_01140 [Candidatus Peregrinibacteria bacterium RIFOXYB2_FULL_33_20]
MIINSKNTFNLVNKNLVFASRGENPSTTTEAPIELTNAQKQFFFEHYRQLQDMPKFEGPTDFPNQSGMLTEDQFVLWYLTKNFTAEMIPNPINTQELVAIAKRTILGKILKPEVVLEGRYTDPRQFIRPDGSTYTRKMPKDVDVGEINLNFTADHINNFQNPPSDNWVTSNIEYNDDGDLSIDDKRTLAKKIGNIEAEALALYAKLQQNCKNYNIFQEGIKESQEFNNTVNGNLAALAFRSGINTSNVQSNIARLKVQAQIPVTPEDASSIAEILTNDKGFFISLFQKKIEFGNPRDNLISLLYILYKSKPNALDSIEKGTLISSENLRNQFLTVDASLLHLKEDVVDKDGTSVFTWFVNKNKIKNPITDFSSALRVAKEASKENLSFLSTLTNAEQVPYIVDALYDSETNLQGTPSTAAPTSKPSTVPAVITGTETTTSKTTPDKSTQEATAGLPTAPQSPETKAAIDKVSIMEIPAIENMDPVDFRKMLFSILEGKTLSATSDDKGEQISFTNTIIDALKDTPLIQTKIKGCLKQLALLDKYIGQYQMAQQNIELSPKGTYTIDIMKNQLIIKQINIASNPKKQRSSETAARLSEQQEERNKGNSWSYSLEQAQDLLAAGIDPNEIDMPTQNVKIPGLGVEIPIDKAMIASVLGIIKLLKWCSSMFGGKKADDPDSWLSMFVRRKATDIKRIFRRYKQIEEAILDGDILSMPVDKDHSFISGNITVPAKTESTEPETPIKIYVNGEEVKRTEKPATKTESTTPKTQTETAPTTSITPATDSSIINPLDDTIEKLTTNAEISIPPFLPPEEIFSDSFATYWKATHPDNPDINQISIVFPNKTKFNNVQYSQQTSVQDETVIP